MLRPRLMLLAAVAMATGAALGAFVAVQVTNDRGSDGESAVPGSADPELRVTPAKNLRDGDPVTVEGTGFRPGADIAIVMCLPEALNGGDVNFCDIRLPVNTRSDGDGAFSATFAPQAIFNSPSGGQTDCRVDECVVAAGNITAPGEESAGAPVTFVAASVRQPGELSLARVEGRDPPQAIVVGRGFLPTSEVGLLLCQIDPATGDPLLAACDYDRGAVVTTDDAGGLSGVVPIGTVPGRRAVIDCAVEPIRCVITTGQSTDRMAVLSLPARLR